MRAAAWIFCAVPALAFARGQVVEPPIARYWMSVDTSAGMNLPGIAASMAGMMGGAAPGRHVLLQLGSRERPSGAPRAEHDIPAGMKMGPSLPLVSPPPEAAARGVPGAERPGRMQRPKGRMLIYWGCGEKPGAGQPAVIDFSKLGPGQPPPQLGSVHVALASPPAPGRSRSYGAWPNREDARAIPADASLEGEHVVKGNYSPEIRFALGRGRDFMQAVALSSTPLASGAAEVRWRRLPEATGYFAEIYGARDSGEVVVWSSSEREVMGAVLMTYLPPAEVARLVRDKVVLPPRTTTCTVPAEVVRRAGTPMLRFIAYGPEANFAQPPRPKDRNVPWKLRWTAKVRFKSTASLLLGEGGAAGASQPPASQPAASQPAESQPSSPPASEPAVPKSVQEGVKEGVKALRGLFGH